MTGRENGGDRIDASALVAFALAALAGAAFLFVRDAPGPAVVRVEELRSLISRGETLGYLDDGDGSDAAAEIHFRTQYALAPALLERGAVHPRVVGRFRRPPPASRLRELGLVLERDLGEGVLLLRREGP